MGCRRLDILPAQGIALGDPPRFEQRFDQLVFVYHDPQYDLAEARPSPLTTFLFAGGIFTRRRPSGAPTRSGLPA